MIVLYCIIVSLLLLFGLFSNELSPGSYWRVQTPWSKEVEGVCVYRWRGWGGSIPGDITLSPPE